MRSPCSCCSWFLYCIEMYLLFLERLLCFLFPFFYLFSIVSRGSPSSPVVSSSSVFIVRLGRSSIAVCLCSLFIRSGWSHVFLGCTFVGFSGKVRGVRFLAIEHFRGVVSVVSYGLRSHIFRSTLLIQSVFDVMVCSFFVCYSYMFS